MCEGLKVFVAEIGMESESPTPAQEIETRYTLGRIGKKRTGGHEGERERERE